MNAETALVRELGPELLLLPPEQQELVLKTASRLVPLQNPIPTQRQTYESTVKGMGIAVDNARDSGFTVVQGTAHTLLLDLDGDTVVFEECLKMLCDLLKEVPTKIQWKSKSGGTHVVFRFTRTSFTEAEAVAIEASLGSDKKRAALNVLRLKNGVLNPRVLFMPKLASEILAVEMIDTYTVRKRFVDED